VSVVVAGDGDVDADGDGLGCVDTVVFELVGAGAQPVISKIRNHESIKSRRIVVILIGLLAGDGATGVPTRRARI